MTPNVANINYFRACLCDRAHWVDRQRRLAGTGSTLLFSFFRAVSLVYSKAYALHERIFNPTRASRQRELKAHILATKAELLQTSAQDQFAKWAKLRRSIDKGLADLEKLSALLVLLGRVST